MRWIIPTDGRNGGNNLSKLELVKYGRLTSGIKSDHQDPHFLLRKQATKELPEGEPHQDTLRNNTCINNTKTIVKKNNFNGGAIVVVDENDVVIDLADINPNINDEEEEEGCEISTSTLIALSPFPLLMIRWSVRMKRSQSDAMPTCRRQCNTAPSVAVVSKNKEEAEGYDIKGGREGRTVQHRYRGGSVAPYRTMRWSTGMKMRQNTVSSTQRRQSITTSTQRRRCGITPNDVMVNENEEEIEQYDTNTDTSPTSSSFCDVGADTE
ncbi:hypothetical protein BHE74_00007703 [Ensete ventricosum]|nr:hypothetical protein BHE74_00007703 [Ensete ventricosum]